MRQVYFSETNQTRQLADFEFLKMYELDTNMTTCKDKKPSFEVFSRLHRSGVEPGILLVSIYFLSKSCALDHLACTLP